MNGRFDLFSAPMNGINLVEASAGTGKTFALTGLYIRLLAEKEDLDPSQILAVTFTKAATQELRDRISRRLRETVNALENPEPYRDDPFLGQAIAQWGGNPAIREKLVRALGEIDQAAVYTIHGFCQHAMQQFIFESNSPFNAEYTGDDDRFFTEAVDNIWRRELQRLEGAGDLYKPLHGFVVEKIGSPDALKNTLFAIKGKPYAKFAFGYRKDLLEEKLREFAGLLEKLIQTWDRNAIFDLLTDGSLNKRSYNVEKVRIKVDELDNLIRENNIPLDLSVSFDFFEKFTTATLASATNKNQTTPHHPFFEASDRFASFEHLEIAEVWCIEMANLFRKEFADLKEAANIRSFDDILESMQQSLTSPEMLEKVRQAWLVALVDEFQDTDPIQLDVFKRIYMDWQADKCLYLIGDPKQSIYRFRGADINSYMEAAKMRGVNKLGLGKNYRSSLGMVEAVNRLFGHVPENEVWPGGVKFDPAEAHRGNEGFSIDGDEHPQPLQFLVNASPDPVNKDTGQQRTNMGIADEISRLLGKGRLGECTINEGGSPRGLRAGDIAILVSAHAEADKIRKVLLRRGIKSVHKSGRSVFNTGEAAFMVDFIRVVGQPGDLAGLRYFLFSEYIGYTTNDLEELETDNTILAGLLETIQSIKDTFENSGFLAMANRFLRVFPARVNGKECTVPERVLRHEDGERMYSNILQISELINELEQRSQPGLEEIQKWIMQKIEQSENNDEAEIRLESDDDLVQIVTMHGCKGLEYPVVFCPSLWHRGVKKDKKAPHLFYDDGEYQVDFCGIGERSLQKVWEEDLAEAIRLMYVAVTRARYRCYISYQTYNVMAQNAGPLHFAMFGKEPTLQHLEGDGRSGSPGLLRENIEAFCAANPAHAALRSDVGIEEWEKADFIEAKPPVGDARKLSRKGLERPDWFITSYSGLKSGMGTDSIIHPDKKPIEIFERLVDKEFSSIHGFPGGASAGVFMHRIFEDLDFENYRAEADEVIKSAMVRDGFDEMWHPVIKKMLSTVMEKKLPYSNIRLSDLTEGRHQKELEFYFPSEKTDGAAAFRIIRGEQAGPTVSTHGFMNGFIDLLFEHEGKFYILDFKSDMLGASTMDYQPGLLADAMETRGYDLQYHLYTVALQRMLKAKLGGAYDYDDHIGGSYYLFLRGMEVGEGLNGIYFHKPEKDVIDELDRFFGGIVR